MNSIYTAGVTGLCYAGMAGIYNELPTNAEKGKSDISPSGAAIYAIAGTVVETTLRSILSEQILKDPIIQLVALPLLSVVSGAAAARSAGYKLGKIDVLKLGALRVCFEFVGRIASTTVKIHPPLTRS